VVHGLAVHERRHRQPDGQADEARPPVERPTLACTTRSRSGRFSVVTGPPGSRGGARLPSSALSVRTCLRRVGCHRNLGFLWARPQIGSRAAPYPRVLEGRPRRNQSRPMSARRGQRLAPARTR
jgi:hypothetical protein